MLDHSYQQMWLICLNMGQIFYKPWASSMVCLKTNLLHLSILYAVWYSSSYNRNCHRCLGRYVIFVAFMSVMSSPDTPVLLDYVQPAVATVDSGMFRTVVIEIFFCIDLCCQYFQSFIMIWITILLGLPLYWCLMHGYLLPSAFFWISDSDIIEGPSRISLNCPIRYAVLLLRTVMFWYLSDLFILLYFVYVYEQTYNQQTNKQNNILNFLSCFAC